MTRRRYDTEALVGEIKRERRNALLLGVGGVVILAFLVIYFLHMRDEPVPSVPTGAGVAAADAKPQQAAAKPEPAQAEAPKAEEKPAPAAEPEPPGPATVVISLPRALPLWIDGKLVGKQKTHTVTLEPGEHVVRTKLGKKSIEEKLEAEPGKRYQVSFDIRRKRATTKVVSE